VLALVIDKTLPYN